MAQELAEVLKSALALTPEARQELARTLLNSLPPGGLLGEPEWIAPHRKHALAGLKRAGRPGFMEAWFRPGSPIPTTTQAELVRAVEKAAIHAFGWPIGIVLHTQQGSPKPMADGIVAEISGIDSSYDYWALRTTGDFYFLGSLFEDERAQQALWFDTRVWRVTEVFLFCYRLYCALGLSDDSSVTLSIRHGGLRGRVLGSARPAIWAPGRTSLEEEVTWTGDLQLSSVKTGIQDRVRNALRPLFILFDFFQPQDSVFKSHIEEFLGKVASQQKPFEL